MGLRSGHGDPGLILFNESTPIASRHIVSMTPLHTFLMIVTAAAWGLNFIATRVVLDVFSPEQLAFARACINLAVLLPWWQPWRPVSVKFLAAAFSIGVVSYYVLYAAIRMTESLTSVAIGTQLLVPISAIIALVMYQEQVTRRRWVGIAVATAGALVLTGTSGPGVSALALGLTLISVTFYSVGTIVASKTGAIGIWRLLAWISAVAVAPMGLIAWVAGPIYPDPETIKTVHWLALVFSALISALLGQAVLFFLYRAYPVSDVAPYFLIVPIFAALFSVLLLHERISPGLAIGGVVILLGVWLQQTRGRTDQRVQLKPDEVSPDEIGPGI
jgi:O-acetylserine/cysteine efflux transporter